MNYKLDVPTKVLFGPNQLEMLHEEKMPGKKCLVVISKGKSTKANGYLDRLYKQLDQVNVDYILFDKVQPNPTLVNVEEGAELGKKENCDFVIGLGGGSSIDAAKAIAIRITNESNYWDYIRNGTGKSKPVENDPLPIVAITTTAGTGSEANPAMVITNESTNEKIGFFNPKSFPVFSIVDPTLMLTVPKNYTAYQGFDALYHAIEGYISNKHTPISDMFALTAIDNIYHNLPIVIDAPDNLEAREKVALGNSLAGCVLYLSSSTSQHSLEHSLSAFYPNLPHGAGLIMLSVAYLKYYIDNGVVIDRFIKMAEIMLDKKTDDPYDFIKALELLMDKCDATPKMSDFGIDMSDPMKYVKNARATMGFKFLVDPKRMSDEDCAKVYQDSFK